MDNVTAAAAPRLWREVEQRGWGQSVPGGGRQEDQSDQLRQGKTVRPDTARRIAAALELPPGQLFYPVREEKRLSARTVLNCHALVAGDPEPGGTGDAHPLQPRPPGHAPQKGSPPAPTYYQPRRWAGS